MSGHVLVDLLVVLVAAKVAAELAERVGVPAVLGEIAAGMLLGPSALGVVHTGEFLQVVGEIGVILLLLEVGMEMDLRELAKVGSASLLVAVGGMVLPFVTGWAALTAIGEGGNTAIFLGAALTATSVGITARAFGDMKALASIESRVVVGAAVADDVLGLIVLTVVARIATGGGISGGEVAGVVVVALGFLVLTTAAGLAVAPRAFAMVQRRAGSAGTMVAIAFAFTLAFAELAQAAELAPIVGAFVAGLSLSRSSQAERISRELAPLGHLFIPVFFFLIGTEAQLSALTDVRVLGLAALMSVLAVAGKVAAGWWAVGTDADRLMVGLGMVPRGEVGLIFATIGRQAGVLDDDLYAALLVVVLLTTVVTPPLLRWRHGVVTAQEQATTDRDRSTDRPAGGWLSIENDHLILHGMPDPSFRLEVALEAARLAGEADPGPQLLDWLDDTSTHPAAWNPENTAAFVELLPTATPRSWRLLDASGVLDAAAPELAAVLASRRRDIGQLDLNRLHDWPILDRLRALTDDGSPDRQARQQSALVDRRDILLLAAVTAEVIEVGGADAGSALVDRLGVSDADRNAVLDTVADANMLRSAAHHLDGLESGEVTLLAAHLGNLHRTRRGFLLALACGEMAGWQRALLDALRDRIEAILSAHVDDVAGETGLVATRRAQAVEMTTGAAQAHRVATAPAGLVLSCPPEELLARLAHIEHGVPPAGLVRVAVEPTASPAPGASDDRWMIVVVGRDTPGFLARVAMGLGAAGVRIHRATAAAWPDGVALDTFCVGSPSGRPDPYRLRSAIMAALAAPLSSTARPTAELEFDNEASPWHTLCTVQGPDDEGVLAAVATAFAAHGINVQSARIDTVAGRVQDRFGLTDRHGRKLDEATRRALRATVEEGVAGGRRRLGARVRMVTGRSA